MKKTSRLGSSERIVMDNSSCLDGSPPEPQKSQNALRRPARAGARLSALAQFCREQKRSGRPHGSSCPYPRRAQGQPGQAHAFKPNNLRQTTHINSKSRRVARIQVSSRSSSISLRRVNGGEWGIRTPGTGFPVQRFSKPPPSATRPTLQTCRDQTHSDYSPLSRCLRIHARHCFLEALLPPRAIFLAARGSALSALLPLLNQREGYAARSFRADLPMNPGRECRHRHSQRARRRTRPAVIRSSPSRPA